MDRFQIVAVLAGLWLAWFVFVGAMVISMSGS